MTFFVVLSVIIVAFGVWLAVKSLLNWRLCVICLAISSVWVGLLIGYRTGWFKDQSLLALLMGQSIAGMYYLFEKRAPRAWLIFRLPLLLTLTYMFYAALNWRFNAAAGLLIIGLWVVFGIVYLFRSTPKLKASVQRIISCCGNW